MMRPEYGEEESVREQSGFLREQSEEAVDEDVPFDESPHPETATTTTSSKPTRAATRPRCITGGIVLLRILPLLPFGLSCSDPSVPLLERAPWVGLQRNPSR